MLKFTRKLFLLFLLVAIVPIFTMAIMNVYNTKKTSEKLLNEMLSTQSAITSIYYTDYLKEEKQIQARIISNLENRNLSLQDYKNILGANKAVWLDSYTSKTDVYYDMVDNNLSVVVVSPLKNPLHKYLCTAKTVPFDKVTPHMPPPTIVRVYSYNKHTSENIVYSNMNSPLAQKFSPIPPAPGPEPDMNTKLFGRTFELKNNTGKTVGTVEIGVPDPKIKLWFVPNPNEFKIFEGFYKIGILFPLLGIILCTIISFYFKNQFITPVEDLAKALKQISMGNHKIKVNTDYNQPEIKEALVNFNKMIADIRENQQLREGFIANLTHDLRTPLISEGRAIEILLEDIDNIDTLQQKDLLNGLLKNNKHLLEMINQLLEAYKFEAGMIKIEKAPVNIKSLIDECFSQVRSLADEKAISLVNNLPDNLPDITGDIKTLKRCFINLISNAIENIPKSSKVEISGKVNDNALEINVKDNGQGITPETAERIFDRFYSGKKSNRKIGSGLGLYICKNFIEAHRGNIVIDSIINKYTNFIISLPIS